MKKGVLFTLLILSTFACEKPSEEVKQAGFDRKVMLTNYYDNLILPAFTALETSTLSLENAVKTLATSPNEVNLANAQKVWEEAYLIFLTANAYNFGPTGEDGLKKSIVEEIGIFPISESKIEANISANRVTFNDFNRDNRGFLAIEYLIFDKSALSKLQSQNRKNYLLAVTEQLKGNVVEAKKGWSGYKNDFITKNGTDAGSSTSQLYNEFVKCYEATKNFKLGLPLGLRAGQTQAEPTKVEGFYSGKSLKFIEAQLKAIENIYHGRGTTDGLGFKEYLETVEGGKALITSTESQILVIKNTLKTVPDTSPMAEQIVKSPQSLKNLQTEMQKQTRFFKSDMSSVLGIAITFSSGDGD